MGTWNYKVIFDYNATQLIADFRRENASLRQAKGTANEDLDFLIYAEKSDHRFSVGKVLLIKMSDGMVDYFNKYTDKNYLITFWSSHIFNEQKNKEDFRETQFTEDDIKYAFETALLMQFKIEGIDLSMVFGFIVEHIDKFYNNFLEKNLLTREEWDPTLKSKKYKFDRHTKFFDIQIKVCNKIIQELRTLHGKLKPYSKYNFKTLDALLKVINFFIKGITAYRDIMTKSKEALQASIAYLCGLWNGIINFIAGLIDLVLLVIKIGIGGVLDVNNLEATALLEGIEEIVNHIEAELETNPNAIEDGIKAALANYKESRYSDPKLNKYQIAYHAGEDTILTINLFLPILALLKRLSSFTRQSRFKEWIDEVLARNGKGARKIGGALLRRGKYLGQIIEEADFVIIEKHLKALRVELQIGSGLGAVEVEGFFLKSGKPLVLETHNAAMFVTDGTKMKIILRENATVYEVLHELMHMRDCQKIGMRAFIEKSLVNREKYVYDKMVEHSKYLNRKELKHAEWYINDRYHKYGVTDNLGNPIKETLPSNLDDIPKKRQEVNIDIILNLK